MNKCEHHPWIWRNSTSTELVTRFISRNTPQGASILPLEPVAPTDKSYHIE